MNRKDFLEILRDYLKGTFNEMEINDILRDYEEFFLNGELEGKSDEEIIKTLGSPKLIARELIDEMKGPGNSGINNNGEFKEKLNNGAKKVWGGVKSTSKKAGEKSKEFLDSSSILHGNMSGTLIKIIMVILTCILIIPAFFVVISMFAGGVTLVFASLGNFLGFVVSILFFGVNLNLGLFGLFICLTWLGFNILFWLLYCLIFKVLKHLTVEYISWIKNRNMYVRVKEKYEEKKENEENISDKVEESNSTLAEDEQIRKEAKEFNGDLGVIEYEYEDETNFEHNQEEKENPDNKDDNGGVTHE